ncbi:hypothetical protein FRC03_007709 [Tulasnella sp. 419]|nr:hypothetical protein FRC03_007709 [Tulasnella sp. 419]
MEYDLIGIGFGPSNLSVAVALIEKWEEARLQGKRFPMTRICFLEKHERFSWHPGMLLPGSRMQISFLKDLATLRRPSSDYTFLSYLHSQNRLLPFINRGSFTPSRKEFADYLTWASDKVRQHPIVTVLFGQDVTGVEAIEIGDGRICVASKDVRTGIDSVKIGRNLIVSPGGQPRIPAPLLPLWMDQSQKRHFIHTSSYVTSIPQIIETSPGPLKVAVIGSGQSSSEVLLDLRSRLPPGSSIDMIFRKGSLKPSDDSPFANEIFDPESTDFMYNLPHATARAHVKHEYMNTNYGVVNPTTLDAVYEMIYDQKLDDSIAARYPDSENHLSKSTRINLLPYHEIVATDYSTDVKLDLQNILTHQLISRSYNLIILGTGYDRRTWIRQLLSASNTYQSFLSRVYFGDLKPALGAEAGRENAKPLSLTNSDMMISVNSVAPVITPPTRSLSPAESIKSETSDDSSSTSPISTNPSSPRSTTIPSLSTYTGIAPSSLHLSRAYRLLPVQEDVNFKPSIYVQGCSEATHGLSDTLLSVISVRSGEIVEDLLSRYSN